MSVECQAKMKRKVYTINLRDGSQTNDATCCILCSNQLVNSGKECVSFGELTDTNNLTL